MCVQRIEWRDLCAPMVKASRAQRALLDRVSQEVSGGEPVPLADHAVVISYARHIWTYLGLVNRGRVHVRKTLHDRIEFLSLDPLDLPHSLKAALEKDLRR